MDIRTSMLLASMMQNSETPIPSRYTPVEWIASNGEQWIDTGIKPDDTTIVQAKFIMFYGGGGSFIGNSANGDEDNFRFFRYGGTTYLDYGSGNNRNRIDGAYIISDTEKYEVEFGNRYVKDLKTNEIKFSGTAVSFNEKDYTIQIFDSTDYGRLYYLKIYKQGSLVADLISVYDNLTQQYGTYDNISKTFKGNEGTGNFTGGTDVHTNAVEVGLPYISSNYILSNFDDNNYLYIPNISDSRNHNYKLTTKFKIGDLTKQVNIFSCDPDQSGIRLNYNSEGGQYSFTILIPKESGDSWINTNSYIISNAYTIADQWMWVQIIKEDNLLQVYTSIDGINFTKIYEYNNDTYINSYIRGLQIIGTGSTDNASEIDLKEVKYYLDGQLSWEAISS